MDYLLENLKPESFQQLAQALIARENPDVQCFPVGQGDGGRDAIAFTASERSHTFLLYQVKFSRFPADVRDPASWIIETLEKAEERVRSGRGSFKPILSVAEEEGWFKE